VLGTLAAVYGWLVPPIGWGYALAIWGYAILWFLINNVVKVEVYRLMRHRGARQARHLRRIHTSLHPVGKLPASPSRRLASGHVARQADRRDIG
jgi:H+-transporting ATPase